MRKIRFLTKPWTVFRETSSAGGLFKFGGETVFREFGDVPERGFLPNTHARRRNKIQPEFVRQLHIFIRRLVEIDNVLL